jgi:hypothetical protein
LCCLGRFVLSWQVCAVLAGLCCLGRFVLSWQVCAVLAGLCCLGRFVLSGCLAVWLSGCLAVWLSGCLAVWLSGCLAVRLPDMLAASLFFVNPPKKVKKVQVVGCFAIRLHNGFVVCFLSESISTGLKSVPMTWLYRELYSHQSCLADLKL